MKIISVNFQHPYQKTASLLLSILFALLMLAPPSVSGLENGLARTPPMGWNTFNHWAGGWGEQVLKDVADSLVATGLRDCGYIYVNADGHNAAEAAWPGQGFPKAENLSVGWAKKMADYCHARQLKFGVYMTSTTSPEATARDLVSAEIDFLKHDDFGKEKCDPIFTRVRDALLATGRPIVLSSNSCDQAAVSNMFRTGPDIDTNWSSIMADLDANYPYLAQAKPGYWPDPDMLEVGCSPRFTDNENRAHFSMWCMMAAPLLIGYNITRLSEVDYMNNNFRLDTITFTRENHIKTIAILGNTEAIAINQDSLGKAGLRIAGQAGGLEVWVKELKDGTKAVAFFNRTSAPASMSITKAQLGWSSAAQVFVRDIWTHANLPNFSGTFTQTVGVHAAEVYRMSSTGNITAAVQMKRMKRLDQWLKRNGHAGVIPSRALSTVLTGSNEAQIFDLHGRKIQVGKRPLGSNILYLKQRGRVVEAKEQR